MASGGADMRVDTVAQIRKRIAATVSTRKESKAKIASGDWRGAETDGTRAKAFATRLDRKLGHAEASRGTNDFQPASFLADGAKARRAVGRTILDTPGETRNATGFLIGGGLFLTNQHVVRNRGEAELTRIVFDDEFDEDGKLRRPTIFSLDPAQLFLTSDEAQLDYALIAVGARVAGSGTLADFGYCALSGSPDRHQLGINANIVQHPQGGRKVVVLRNNVIVARDDEVGRLFYETDTLEGSSGAPVFNDLWDVVALHHYGEASEDVTLANGAKTRAVNEGIRISSIYDDLGARLANLDERGRALLQTALVLWKADAPPEKRLEPRVRVPDPVARPEAASASAGGAPVDDL